MSYFSNKHMKYNEGTSEDVKQQDAQLIGRRTGMKRDVPDKKYHSTIDKMSHEQIDAYYDRKRAKLKALQAKKK